MSTAAQINANRENAKSSTGPTSEAGAARSSQNARKHGLTGQTLILPPDECEAYEVHVQHYMDRHKPGDYHHRELVQQLADSNWVLNQVFVQQTATLSIMMKITSQMSAGGDPAATAAALVSINRTLATLSTYESRRRRTVKAIEKDLAELEEQLAAAQKSKETKTESEIGFVYAPMPQAAPARQSRDREGADADPDHKIPSTSSR